MNNKEAYERWAETQPLQKAIFWWKAGRIESECVMYDKTFNEALKIAREFGYVEPRWFKPWTWGNGVITVG